MKLKRYDDYELMIDDIVALVTEQLSANVDKPHAIVLPGGNTPAPMYKRIMQNPFTVDKDAYVIISDERYVVASSNLYNYGKLIGMVAALGVAEDHVLNVNTSLEFKISADDFDKRLTSFMGGGGVVALAVLGLGMDGHTASLLSKREIREAEGRYAIPVIAHEGPDRISLTSDFLSQAQRTVLLVAGTGKADIVRRLEQSPETVVAGVALAHSANAEIWYHGGIK